MISHFECWDCGAVLPFSDATVEHITEGGWIGCGCNGRMHAVFPKGERLVWPQDNVLAPNPLIEVDLSMSDTPMPNAFAGFISGMDLSGLEEA